MWKYKIQQESLFHTCVGDRGLTCCVIVEQSTSGLSKKFRDSPEACGAPHALCFNVALFDVFVQLSYLWPHKESCDCFKSKRRSAGPLHLFREANKSPGVSVTECLFTLQRWQSVMKALSTLANADTNALNHSIHSHPVFVYEDNLFLGWFAVGSVMSSQLYLNIICGNIYIQNTHIL